MVRLRKFNKIENVIFFPSELGQKKIGVSKTPSIIKDSIIKKCKRNNLRLPKMYWIGCNESKDIYRNLSTLYDANDRVRGRKINIGGDHSMSIATVANSLNNYSNLKLIWIDAHADINTSYSSPTNNLHGMPLGYLSNLDEDDNFDFIYNHINFKNILYIGVRELDTFEKEVYKYTNKISTLSTSYPFHISFDVDSIDPIFIPSTGTKVENGLSIPKAKTILDFLYKYKGNQIVNVDLCELNLEIGSKKEAKLSLDNTLYLFNRYF